MVKKICAKCFIWIMLIMMYLPILVLCVYSFTDSTTLVSWHGFSFELYNKLFARNLLLKDYYENTWNRPGACDGRLGGA